MVPQASRRRYSKARTRRVLAALVLTAILSSPLAHEAHAGPPAFLVKDINQRTSTCFPSERLAAGGFVFALYACGRHELWRTDGGVPLLLGTFDVASDLTWVNGQLVFTAADADHGTELWRSDGTPAGTELVGEIRPGPDSAEVNDLFALGGEVYFGADDGSNGRELWKSDGTPGSITLVKDLLPGPASSFPQTFFSTGGLLLFAATSDGVSLELWRSDGTGAGTFAIGAAAPYDGSSGAFHADLGGVAVFAANAPGDGTEPWRTDGTGAGTFQLADIVPGVAGSGPRHFSGLGGAVVFAAASALWATDGTIGGTGLVANVEPSYSAFTPFGGLLYFGADDGASGFELWSTDGTSPGTTLVADIDAGPGDSYPGPITVDSGWMYFSAGTAAHGRELWRSDGTGVGTSLVLDINAGAGQSDPRFITAAGGLIFFVADDGIAGNEVWRSDGTAAGTFLPLATLFSSVPLATPIIFGTIGANLIFHSPGTSSTMWRSDGSTAGTEQLLNLTPTAHSDPASFAELGGVLYFSASDPGSGSELWRSDGTESGTVLTKDIKPGPGDGGPYAFVELGGALYFSADDGSAGRELWRTDGSEPGTVLVADLEPGSADSSPSSLTRAGSLVFFTAETSASGREPWVTDGTPGGTMQLADINAGAASSNPMDLVAMGGEVFFFAFDGSDQGLWRSDGSPAGTTLVAAIAGSGLMTNGSALFFASSDTANGTEPWTSDGTPGGTTILADINPGSASSSPTALTAIGARVYFVATAPATGYELWSTEGIGSTALVADLSPGAGSSALDSLAEVGGRLYFRRSGDLYVSDGTAAGTMRLPAFPYFSSVRDIAGTAVFTGTGHGAAYEPWRSDGTAEGTWRIAVVGQAPVSSSPWDYTLAGDNVFFSANDGQTGRELWAIPLSSLLICGEPDPSCDGALPGSAVLTMKDRTVDSGDKFFFRWKNAAPLSFSGLGNPLGTTRYEICVYDRTLGVPQLALRATVPANSGGCVDSACWRQRPSGYLYTDPDRSRYGIRKLLLKWGDTGRGKIIVRGIGERLLMPTASGGLLLQQDPAVTVQVKSTDGACWSADFAAPALRNVDSAFRDKSD